MESGYQCDACDHEMSGYTKRELIQMGWVWHAVKRGSFVMCDVCEDRNEQRRIGKAAA